MKTAVLCGFALLYASASFAQTTPASPASQPRSITLTGCVGGGTSAQPITLANAMIVPSTDTPTANSGAATSPVPGGVSQPPTPTTPAAPPGPVGTAGSPTGTPPPVGTAGTTGAGVGTAGTTGAGVGTAGAHPPAGIPTPGAMPPATAGAPPTTPAPTAVGTAPAGSSASSVSGYRLTGADMTGWIGRRVQIVGQQVPTTAGASATNPAVTASSTLPEFRVVSVQPISGDCPPQQQ